MLTACQGWSKGSEGLRGCPKGCRGAPQGGPRGDPRVFQGCPRGSTGSRDCPNAQGVPTGPKRSQEAANGVGRNPKGLPRGTHSGQAMFLQCTDDVPIMSHNSTVRVLCWDNFCFLTQCSSILNAQIDQTSIPNPSKIIPKSTQNMFQIGPQPTILKFKCFKL